MLVLTRKLGESIIIGDGIEVCLLKVSGNRAVLGVTAPQEVRIDRMEVANRKDKEEADESGKTPSEDRRKEVIGSSDSVVERVG